MAMRLCIGELFCASTFPTSAQIRTRTADMFAHGPGGQAGNLKLLTGAGSAAGNAAKSILWRGSRRPEPMPVHRGGRKRGANDRLAGLDGAGISAHRHGGQDRRGSDAPRARADSCGPRARSAPSANLHHLRGLYLDQPKITCTMGPTSCPWPIPPNLGLGWKEAPGNWGP